MASTNYDQPQSFRRRPRPTWFAGAIVLLWIFFALRLTNLMALPLFIDEATGINRARDALIGFPYQGLAHAKWLGTFIIALFRPFGPETLWLSRAATGLLALLSCASALALGRIVGGRYAGLVAGLIVTVLPYGIFLDRQALADPLATAFSAVMLVGAYCLARQPTPLHAAITGAALAAAILSKFSAAILIPVPVITALLLAPGGRRRALAISGLALALAAVLILGVFALGDRHLQGYQSILNDDYSWGWLRRHAGLSPGARPLPERWGHTIQRLSESFTYFFGWPLIVLALIAPLLASRRAAIWLWISGPLALLPLLAVVTWLPVRYLSTAVVPLATLAALAITDLATQAGTRWKRGGVTLAAGGLLVGLTLLPLLPHSTLLLISPEQANLPPFEAEGYFGPDHAAIGLVEIHDALSAYTRTHSSPVHIIHADINYLHLYIIWGTRTGLLESWQDTFDQQAELARWLVAGDSVLFIDAGSLGETPYGARTALVASISGPSGSVYRLREVTKPGPELLEVVYGEVFGNPAGISSDYDGLAALLRPGQTAAYFPPHQRQSIHAALGGRAIHLVELGDGWPLDLAAITSQLEGAAAEDDLISIVFFNETAGDPGREIETWLNTHLFRLGERWVGALRVLEYVSPVGEMTVATPHALYGDQIRLDSSAVGRTVVDGQPLLLVELQMEAATPISLSYKLGAYVLDGDQQVVAQYDAIPQGYLAPTTTWAPGQIVIDRFAIRLPPDLPPGAYRLAVAFYDEATLAQLLVSSPSGAPTLVDIFQFTID